MFGQILAFILRLFALLNKLCIPCIESLILCHVTQKGHVTLHQNGPDANPGHSKEEENTKTTNGWGQEAANGKWEEKTPDGKGEETTHPKSL